MDVALLKGRLLKAETSSRRQPVLRQVDKTYLEGLFASDTAVHSRDLPRHSADTRSLLVRSEGRSSSCSSLFSDSPRAARALKDPLDNWCASALSVAATTPVRLIGHGVNESEAAKDELRRQAAAAAADRLGPSEAFEQQQCGLRWRRALLCLLADGLLAVVAAEHQAEWEQEPCGSQEVDLSTVREISLTTEGSDGVLEIVHGDQDEKRLLLRAVPEISARWACLLQHKCLQQRTFCSSILSSSSSALISSRSQMTTSSLAFTLSMSMTPKRNDETEDQGQEPSERTVEQLTLVLRELESSEQNYLKQLELAKGLANLLRQVDPSVQQQPASEAELQSLVLPLFDRLYESHTTFLAVVQALDPRRPADIDWDAVCSHLSLDLYAEYYSRYPVIDTFAFAYEHSGVLGLSFSSSSSSRSSHRRPQPPVQALRAPQKRPMDYIMLLRRVAQVSPLSKNLTESILLLDERIRTLNRLAVASDGRIQAHSWLKSLFAALPSDSDRSIIRRDPVRRWILSPSLLFLHAGTYAILSASQHSPVPLQSPQVQALLFNHLVIFTLLDKVKTPLYIAHPFDTFDTSDTSDSFDSLDLPLQLSIHPSTSTDASALAEIRFHFELGKEWFQLSPLQPTSLQHWLNYPSEARPFILNSARWDVDMRRQSTTCSSCGALDDK